MENSNPSTGRHDQNQDQTNSSGAFGNLTDMLGGIDFNKIPEKLKEYGTAASQKISGLSTTQKVIGGALLVLGARYLSKRSNMSFRNKMGRKKA